MAQELKNNLKTVNTLFEGHETGRQKDKTTEQKQETWNKLKDAKKNRQFLEGFVIAIESHQVDNDEKDESLFGVVEFEDIRGYISIDEFPADNKGHLNTYVGTPVSFKVLSADQQEDGFFVGSRKQALEQMQEYFDKVAENNKAVKAIVNKVSDKEVRANVGGYEITLPITDMGFGWVRDLHSLVSTGDIIDVMVLNKGKKGKKPKISRKAALKNPFPDCLNRYQQGGNYLGKVTGFIESGVFVNLEQGVDTLAIAEYVEDIGVGDKVVVKISNIKKQKGVNKDTPPDKQYQIKSSLVRKI